MGDHRDSDIPPSDTLPLDTRERRLVRRAARQLDAIPTGGPAPAVFEALRACAPLIGGLIGVMGTEMSGSSVSHVVGLPTEVLEGWATTPLPHLVRMMAPITVVDPGSLVSDRVAITGKFRDELELMDILASAGLGETAGYKVAARTTFTGQQEHRFITFALEGGQIFTPRQRHLFRLLQPRVEAALARMEVPLLAHEPMFAQIVEASGYGFLALSPTRAIVELNERAHEIVLRYLEPARVPIGRGALARFVDRAADECKGGRPWRLFRPDLGLAVEIRAHHLVKEMHHAGQDITLLMMSEIEISMPPTDRALTARQRDVARLLATTSLTYKEIAERLGLAEGTVRKHIENVYRAYDVTSRTALAFKLHLR